jgi:hypothetical protein
MPEDLAAVIGGYANSEVNDDAGRLRLPSMYRLRVAYGMSDYEFFKAQQRFGADAQSISLPGNREIFVSKRVRAVLSGAQGGEHSLSVIAKSAGLRFATVRRFMNSL